MKLSYLLLTSDASRIPIVQCC